ncbi:hypothetical protein KIPB_010264 [Kipferlia bialata]|uniref:Dynein regulatory complex subunit 7 C-terminal domain-containing protein n=1 Tax=Kipferlia bialata TaxID=797122 RepID=A0A9K3GM86_9EUKA|nr:hypothetical protein KIPB_010264 [Kipferlia bialata]|eukprot:g10264.t1
MLSGLPARMRRLKRTSAKRKIYKSVPQGLEFTPHDILTMRRVLHRHGLLDRLKKLTEVETDDRPASSERDYLCLFLPRNYDEGKFSLPDARKIRVAALTALRERLVERASIIQSRLDAENEALRRKQAAFRKAAGQMSPEEEEHYVTEFNQAMFRIKILEARLKRHEERALRKYAELDQRLRRDPRLSALQDKASVEPSINRR